MSAKADHEDAERYRWLKRQLAWVHYRDFRGSGWSMEARSADFYIDNERAKETKRAPERDLA